MKLKFYGTRSSAPVYGADCRRFGGATTCCLLTSENTQIMIDAGSGVTSALRDIDTEGKELYLLITHTHLDHISGIVSLLPAFAKGKLHVYGKTRDGLDIFGQIQKLMSPPIWPLPADAVKNITYSDIPEGRFTIGDFTVSTMESNHPGGCTLLRFDAANGKDSVVIGFDFNHADGFADRLAEFAKGAELLVYDGGMSEEEYATHPDWGHSTPGKGAEIAAKAGTRLIVTHHPTFDSDTQLEEAQKELRKICPDAVFATDGMSVEDTDGGIKITSATERERDVLGCLLDVGMMLSSEKDADVLLEKITRAAMYITGADGGTLYLLNDDELNFRIMITKSKNFFKGGKGDPIDLPPVKLRPDNVCTASVLERRMINIPDAYDNNRYDFSGPRRYDAMNGYKTTSILVVPMVNDRDDIIGVMQLINATDCDGRVIPFPHEDEKILSSIASQAAISITNMNYSKQVAELLNGFVRVMSTGIDARTPYNANHTRNMVKYGDKFLKFENATGGRWSADERMSNELLMSVWLHDIGKLITPLEIMDKSTRLGEDGLAAVENRFRRIQLMNRIEFAEGKCSESDFEARRAAINADLDLIHSVNTAGFLPDEKLALIDAMKAKTFTDDDGTEQAYINDTEYARLSIRKGTLTNEERSIMQSHVSYTAKMLSGLEFPKDFSEVPFWAGSHHEFLNGFGYPNHLKAEQIPWQVRLITILDVFEALTARDRPYKPPMPVEKALGILDAMVRDGQIDAEILEEFKKSRAWED